ncbi:hypothetical protein VCUG_00728 [Vavraia culicis subsp. floridensis]|uniref:Uncharacterized protein n=1 Tax=Vavraia culicis (isolate floridensis) TaxID=948595 RepID=L2GWN3_VAVCU|nr:uncharacterized protein VCUG_00728 [Vavraia culicis subsp. floridensis]ELA47767.1 hypothetical protein VCUG_00728 [Vavraia culicis subsp. floridensis]
MEHEVLYVSYKLPSRLVLQVIKSTCSVYTARTLRWFGNLGSVKHKSGIFGNNSYWHLQHALVLVLPQKGVLLNVGIERRNFSVIKVKCEVTCKQLQQKYAVLKA